MDNKRIDEPTGTETVGHEWDGIEELNTPLPRWWLWTFYLTIIWAAAFVVAYPAWPMISKGTEGMLGWTSRGQLAQEMSAADQARASVREQLAQVPIERLGENSQLLGQAVAGGRAAFLINCVQCHGSGAAGSNGYPNLNDDDWLWGGDVKAIETTLAHGIRQPGDAATRMSLMPAFGRDGILNPQQVAQVAQHVLSLSGKADANAAGAALFSANCAVCHGPDGRGLRQFGAPNLADAIWLHADRADAITPAELQAFITNPAQGVMPSWQGRLDPVTIKMLAAYVHSLGGGEDFVEVAATPAVEANAQP